MEITADKDKIDQALKNIISNAIKYSPENSHVCLSARRIWVESKFEKGTTVTFTLPV